MPIEEKYVSLRSIMAKAIFARHIAHILPNYHTERIREPITNHREVAL